MNLKPYILLLLLTGLFFMMSCTSNTILKEPDNLIPKEKMVDLLTDMYIANAAFSVKNKNLNRKIDYIPLVYEKHQIDSLRFHTSNLYYMSRIDDYELIYKEVEVRLKEMSKEAEATKMLEDSLNLKKKELKKKLK